MAAVAQRAVIQPLWKDQPEVDYLAWSPLVEGVEWRVPKNKPNLMYYVVVNKSQINRFGHSEGPQNARSRSEWLQDQNSDPLANEDARVIALPGNSGVHAVDGTDKKALTDLSQALQSWQKAAEEIPSESVRKQYYSQITGLRSYVDGLLNTSKPKPFQLKNHFGFAFVNGVIYLAFRFTEAYGVIKLESIVKSPMASEILGSREQNTLVNQSAHDLLQTLSKNMSVALEADTEDLVETYYKYGYHVDLKDFVKPDDIGMSRWAEIARDKKPTKSERAQIALKNKVLNARWDMIRN